MLRLRARSITGTDSLPMGSHSWSIDIIQTAFVAPSDSLLARYRLKELFLCAGQFASLSATFWYWVLS